MRVQRVYLDTSVIGGCCDIEFQVWSEGLLRDFEMGFLKPVISELVTAELEAAPPEVLEKLDSFWDCDPEIVDINEEMEDLASAYLARGILSGNYADDARHIACATVAEVDVLVSWNFRHVVHLEKMRLFNAVNLDRGYKAIQILSPREVTKHGNQGS
ncbi:MAG: type II toxin-antitoxin system VapC family toxin [Planctomycetaceae bacterium]|nr:type II toxin-antitoxin system VapC family toxin [Planctomycetaceae bacterium]